jgi:hypothetical protein
MFDSAQPIANRKKPRRNTKQIEDGTRYRLHDGIAALECEDDAR